MMLKAPGYEALSINFEVIGLTRPGIKPLRSKSPDLPKGEMGALLIRPSRLVTDAGNCSHLNFIHFILLQEELQSRTIEFPRSIPLRHIPVMPSVRLVTGIHFKVIRLIQSNPTTHTINFVIPSG